MKLSKRLLSLALALVMMCSVLAVSASAASKTTVKRYKTYTALGDSIGAGFSMPDYEKYNRLIVVKQRIEGAYPSIVADYVQAKTFYPLCQPGFRTAELRILFDDSFDGDSMDKDGTWQKAAGTPYDADDVKAQRAEYRKKVAASDLVTLECGLNDTYHPLLAAVYKINQGKALSDDYQDDVYDWLSDFGTVGEAVAAAYAAIPYVLTAPQSVYYLMEALYKSSTDMIKNYDAVVKGIYECNPDVTIVAVSTYAPFGDWEIPPGSGIKLLGGLLEPLYLAMNSKKESYVDEYPGKYYYADITDTEVRSNKTPSSLSEGFDPHPTIKGHRMIANHIVEALPKGSNRKKNWSRSASDMPTLTKGSSGWGTYLDDGTLNTTYTGLAKIKSGKMYYVKNGKWKKSFSGKVYTYAKTYTVKNGVAQ